MNQTKTKSIFKFCTLVLMYLIGIYSFIAVHASFFPFVTELLSKAPALFYMIISIAFSLLHIMFEDEFNGLFDINIKLTLPFYFSFTAIKENATKKEMALMGAFLFYILLLGMLFSALLSIFFSFGNVWAKWFLYGCFIVILFMGIKRILASWVIKKYYPYKG